MNKVRIFFGCVGVFSALRMLIFAQDNADMFIGALLIPVFCLYVERAWSNGKK